MITSLNCNSKTSGQKVKIEENDEFGLKFVMIDFLSRKGVHVISSRVFQSKANQLKSSLQRKTMK